MEFSLAEAIVTFFGILLSSIIFFYNRRRNQIEIIEKSFDYLQRINEKALESSENVVAALKSIRHAEDIPADEARIIYFTYMRFNRLFRMWIYMERGFVSKSEAIQVIRDGLPAVKEAEQQLHVMLARAYPAAFIRFLESELKLVEAPPLIAGELNGQAKASV